ncbi:MAG: crotonase/enoyl-CoA hydratase family protein [Alphaproteobacteria bacterium]|nr:crotonase/enoyl-CoA hydratase family protein [Alphaproteobacteria bacterium]
MSAVRVERNGAVTTVILDRAPRRNAVDRPTADALSDAFAAFEQDTESRVAVLWGAGGHFCSGADLKALAEGRANRRCVPSKHPDPLTPDAPMGPTRMRLSKPVIAAVAGYAVAGGFELALWCDLRVAEEDAVFGIFSRRWGVPLIDGGTVRLPRLIGQSRALDMILTGRPVGAAEALAMGLVNRLVPKGEGRAAAEALAAALAAFPQACLANDRSSVYEQFDLDFTAAMENEFARGMRTLASGEAQEGAARFAAGAGRHGSLEGR